MTKPIDKINDLIKFIQQYENVAIAYSGGVNSTLLLTIAQMALGDKMSAITIRSPYIAGWEIENAVQYTRQHNIKHRLFEIPFLHQLKDNPVDRCFWCKHYIYRSMLQEISKEGIKELLDGSDLSDIQEFHPGLQALKELNIISPLIEFKINKQEVRILAQHLNLPNWERTANRCLLSRLPFKEEVKRSDLKQIEQAEKFLINIGFPVCRVRKHGNLARIELNKDDLPRFLNAETFHWVSLELKNIGFIYISLDMEGYREGSANEAL